MYVFCMLGNWFHNGKYISFSRINRNCIMHLCLTTGIGNLWLLQGLIFQFMVTFTVQKFSFLPSQHFPCSFNGLKLWSCCIWGHPKLNNFFFKIRVCNSWCTIPKSKRLWKQIIFYICHKFLWQQKLIRTNKAIYSL